MVCICTMARCHDTSEYMYTYTRTCKITQARHTYIHTYTYVYKTMHPKLTVIFASLLLDSSFFCLLFLDNKGAMVLTDVSLEGPGLVAGDVVVSPLLPVLDDLFLGRPGRRFVWFPSLVHRQAKRSKH